jgi:hypothetical protein
VAGIVDVVNVLVYRDQARGSDGMLFHARGELAAGPVLIGVETCDIGIDPATFWEEGRAALDRELALFARRHRSHPSFCGFSIHDHGCYRDLSP